MNLTLVGWRNATTLLVVQNLPLQTAQSASILVSNYLSDVGGWVPDSALDPTGAGVPANGETTDDAATSIIALQYSKIHELRTTVTLVVDLVYHNNITTGQPDETILALSEEQIEELIEAQLADTILRVASFDNTSATIINGGETTQVNRQEIEVDINSQTKLIDPKSIALQIARSVYALDDTYNVSKFYKETDTELVFVIIKYETNQYAVVDSTAINQYVLTLDPSNYTLFSGLVRPI